MRLSILIATTEDRRPMFNELYQVFVKQIEWLPVEIKYLEDNKEMSIGNKRQKLLEMATGDYIVFFDSDDMPYSNYVSSILKALESNPDCVGFKIHMTTNGNNPKTCCHSRQYRIWENNVDGYDYVRNVTHFNPVKRELALRAGFRDMRFGEDKDYADRVTSYCRKEFFIDEELFHYRYTTHTPHKEKYGIR